MRNGQQDSVSYCEINTRSTTGFIVLLSRGKQNKIYAGNPGAFVHCAWSTELFFVPVAGAGF